MLNCHEIGYNPQLKTNRGAELLTQFNYNNDRMKDIKILIKNRNFTLLYRCKSIQTLQISWVQQKFSEEADRTTQLCIFPVSTDQNVDKKGLKQVNAYLIRTKLGRIGYQRVIGKQSEYSRTKIKKIGSLKHQSQVDFRFIKTHNSNRSQKSINTKQN